MLREIVVCSIRDLILMTAILIPPGYSGRQALAFFAEFNKVPVTITEDPSALAPTFASSPDPVFGFLSVAFALARQATALGDDWAAKFLGDGNPEASAGVAQFASIADSIFAGTTADVKSVMGQVQTYGKSRLFLVGDSLTAADLLMALAVHPVASSLTGPELQDLADAVRWINQILQTVHAPLAPIALTAAGPKREKRPAPADKPPPKKAAATKKAPPPPKEPSDPFALLDIRIALIVRVRPHPNADTLYCEDVDVGDGRIRHVVTGVRLFVPIEQMENRRCVCFVNIKPSKVRGELSESMLFAASNDDHTAVEMLDPPEGTPIGTRVTCGDIQLVEQPPVDAKGKVWKAATENESFRINADHIACYKGVPLAVPEGPITVATLANCEFH